jgi:hypothetical protein
VASGLEILDVPKALHLPIAQMAVVLACGAIEDTGEQNLRLQAMRRSVVDVVSVYASRQGRAQFGAMAF